MENKANRWMTSALLLAMFGVIAIAGSNATKAQTTQNVLVTNVSSQPVPVLPAARPAPGGAYIVSVANAPNVKVVASPTSPLSTKEVNNLETSLQMATGTGQMAAGSIDFLANVTPSASASSVVDEIHVWTGSGVAGETGDYVEVQLISGGSFMGYITYPMQATNHGNYTILSASTRIPVPAGVQVRLVVWRYGGNTSYCDVTYGIVYHTIQSP